jgi:Ribbon-helix-helix protein, copG family
MTKSPKAAPKRKPGRPASGGRDPAIQVRMSPALTAEIDAWASKAGTTRSEAIRRLIEAGLKLRPKPTRTTKSS